MESESGREEAGRLQEQDPFLLLTSAPSMAAPQHQVLCPRQGTGQGHHAVPQAEGTTDPLFASEPLDTPRWMFRDCLFKIAEGNQQGFEKKKKKRQMRQALKNTQMKPQRNITLKEGAFPGAGAPRLPPSPMGGTHAWHPLWGACTSLQGGFCFLPSPWGSGTRSKTPTHTNDFIAQSHFLLLLSHHPAPPQLHASGKKALSVTRHMLPRPLNSEEIMKTM